MYEGPTERGSCEQACFASVFELPEALAPTVERIHDWLGLNFPGVGYAQRGCEPAIEVAPTPPGLHGFWIAWVHTATPGFAEPCGRCWEFEGNENGPPLAGFGNERPCPFCGERWGLPKGTRPGYHAVVMQYGRLAHDPLPGADQDPERELVFVGAAWFVVADPARLVARVLPALREERG